MAPVLMNSCSERQEHIGRWDNPNGVTNTEYDLSVDQSPTDGNLPGQPSAEGKARQDILTWDGIVATHDKSNDPKYKRPKAERTIKNGRQQAYRFVVDFTGFILTQTLRAWGLHCELKH